MPVARVFRYRVMTDTLICWKCGAPITDLSLPIVRLAECAACRADLHVCRICGYCDFGVALSCHATRAEEVKEKERDNFCEYLAAKAGAYSGYLLESHAARLQLDALFGGGPAGTRQDNGKTVSRSQADAAREQLEQLFGSRGKGEI